MLDSKPFNAVRIQAEECGESMACREWKANGDNYKSVTYASLKKFVTNGATNLAEGLGVAFGERVAILSDNSFKFYVAILSLQCMNAIPVVLPWNFSVLTLNELSNDSNIVLVGRNFLPLAQKMVTSSSNAPRLVAMMSEAPPISTRTSIGFETWNFDKVYLGAEFATPRRHLHHNITEAIVFYTTSFTMRPNAIVLDFSTLNYMCNSSDNQKGDAVLVLTPNYHALHLIEGFLKPIILRSTWCSAVGYDNQNCSSIVCALRPQVVYITSSLAQHWNNKDILHSYKLRLITDGGASTKELAQRIHATRIFAPCNFGIPILESDSPDSSLQVLPQISAFALNDQGYLVVRGYLADDTWTELKTDQFIEVTTHDNKRLLGLEWLCRGDHSIVLSSYEVIPPMPLEVLVEDTLLLDETSATGIVCVGNGREKPYILIEQPVNSTQTMSLQKCIDSRLQVAYKAAKHIQPTVRDALFFETWICSCLIPVSALATRSVSPFA
mmetsp:Transcript_19866/g.30258  ORF Transcript_19866/g.30258 Transcript_19866/m.30258 type:complete len:497 (+) Transcript_19866:173-1663(+)